ncbi:MAG: hypothetical protein WA393_11450 [Nitrososphaeraceae archaeon]
MSKSVLESLLSEHNGILVSVTNDNIETEDEDGLQSEISLIESAFSSLKFLQHIMEEHLQSQQKIF